MRGLRGKLLDAQMRALMLLTDQYSGVARWPAAGLAAIRFLADHATYRTARQAAFALGYGGDRTAALRLLWELECQHASHLVLAAQAGKLHRAWVREHVSVEGDLPPDGAVVIALHQANVRIAFLALAERAPALAYITTEPVGPLRTGPPAGAHEEAVYVRCEEMYTRIFGGRLLKPPGVMGAAADLLRAGVSVILQPDYARPDWPEGVILGRRLPYGPGAVALAQRSGRPIVPVVLIPRDKRWLLWVGAPVPAKQLDLPAAIEEMVRRAPSTWQLAWWAAWRDAPASDAGSNPEPIRAGL